MSKKVKIRIFEPQEKELPSYLKQTPQGLLVISPIEGKPGPYDSIYDFGQSQASLRKIVPLKERLVTNFDTLVFAELERPEITVAMKKVTEINRDYLPDDDQARLAYQRELFKVYGLMKPLVEERIHGRTVFFPPKNGGDLVRAMFQELGIIKNPNDVVDYELKRVLLTDGRLMVGVVNHLSPKGQFETACIIDDCAASIISLLTSADLVKSQYPEIRNLVVVVSAGTQRGVLKLDQELREGFWEHSILVGGRVFAMSNNYYLLRTIEEGFKENTQFVGDMGAWSKKLPEEFNEVAWWNKNRLEKGGELYGRSRKERTGEG